MRLEMRLQNRPLVDDHLEIYFYLSTNSLNCTLVSSVLSVFPFVAGGEYSGPI